MRQRSFIVGIAALIGFVLFVLAGFFRPVRSAIGDLFLPIARVVANSGEAARRLFRADPDARASLERAEELEARLQTITVDYVRLRALEEENAALLAQARYRSSRGFQTLGARIISRAMTAMTAAVTIDRGRSDGVEEGDAVMTDAGVFVGKVIATGDRTATVLLVSDASSRTAATVAGSRRVAGIVEGRGNGVARFTLIPQDVDVKRDDVIVTAGTEAKIPPDLVIGLVNDVESKPTDPFKNASIEPLVDLDRLELVSVVIPGSL